MKLKANEIGANDNTVSTWMEFLRPTTAKPLAYVDHPFFGKWPCITENAFGKGHLIYVGTVPSDDLLQKLVARAADRKNIATVTRQLHFPVIARSGMNGMNKPIHYIFNFSVTAQQVVYPFKNSISLLDSQKLNQGDLITVAPWNVVIGEEK